MKKLYIFFLLFVLTVIHSFAQTNPAPCTDLFFSEYVEGSSNNKALEIYNPTTSIINLSNYSIFIQHNGLGSKTVIVMGGGAGSLNPGSTFVIANSGADTLIKKVANSKTGSLDFNGNDFVGLLNLSTADTIDGIGIIGEDPAGGAWTVGTGTTKDYTLVRKSNVQNGQLDWSIGATEWDVYPIDDFTHLGSHTMTPCSISGNPDVYLVSSTQSVGEGDDSVTVLVGIHNANSNATSVTVKLSDFYALNPDDYYLSSGGDSVIITFPANSSAQQSMTVKIVPDATVEGDETFQVSLINPTNSAIVTGTSEEITIVDDDAISAENIFDRKSISLFPNPAHEFCVLSLDGSFEQLVITDVTGKVMSEQTISGQRTVYVNMKSLPSGIYFANCYGAKENLKEKIVKQ